MPTPLTVDPAALLAAMSRVGLAPPTAISPLGSPRVQSRQVLHCPSPTPQNWLLVEEQVSPGWDTIGHESSAIEWLCEWAEIPVPDTVHRLAPHLLGRSACLIGPLPGVPAADLLATGRLDLTTCARLTGEVRAALDDLAHPTHATLPTAAWGFVPQHETWKDAWQGLHHAYRQFARRLGVGLGPLQMHALDRFEDQLEALDTASEWTLVHRDLQPSNLWLDPETLSLQAVLGWSGAIIGDPLVDWIQPLQLPGIYLSAFIQGAGEQATRRLESPEARARLDCYAITRALARLAMAGLPQRTRLQRAEALEHSHREFEDLRDNHWTRTRLEASHRPRSPAIQIPRIPLRQQVLRATLDAFGQVPRPSDENLEVLLTALAWSQLVTPDPSQDRRGAALIEALPTTLGPAAAASGTHSSRTAEDWAKRVVAQAQGDRISAVLLWLLSDLDDSMWSSLPPASLDGFSAVLTSRLHQEQKMPSGSMPDRRLVGCLAWLLCAQRWPSDATQRRQAAVVAEAEECWDAMCPIPPTLEPKLPPEASWPPSSWVPTQRRDGERVWWWLALHALRPWPLSVSPGTLWEWIDLS